MSLVLLFLKSNLALPNVERTSFFVNTLIDFKSYELCSTKVLEFVELFISRPTQINKNIYMFLGYFGIVFLNDLSCIVLTKCTLYVLVKFGQNVVRPLKLAEFSILNFHNLLYKTKK